VQSAETEVRDESAVSTVARVGKYIVAGLSVRGSLKCVFDAESVDFNLEPLIVGYKHPYIISSFPSDIHVINMCRWLICISRWGAGYLSCLSRQKQFSAMGLGGIVPGIVNDGN